MSITFDRATNIFQLNTMTTSYLIGIADGKYVGHIYYGKKLDNCQGGYELLRTEEKPFVPSQNNRDKAGFADGFHYEYPTAGVGDYRESCLSVRTWQGHRVCELAYTGYEIFDGKRELPGLPATFETDSAPAKTLEITCEDATLGLKAVLGYSVFEDSDAVVRSARLINEGAEPLYIERALSACLDMDEESFEMLTLTGSWARERHITRCPVTYGKHAASSVRGCSSHQEHPFAALMTPGTTQDAGEVYAMHFVYSGNFLALSRGVLPDPGGGVRIFGSGAGENDPDAARPVPGAFDPKRL